MSNHECGLKSMDTQLPPSRSGDAGLPRLVVLTGAGISAESGVATFRGAGGLWEGHRIEDVATPDAWGRDPELVWRFYQLRREGLLSVEPNPAHHALVRLEQAWLAAEGPVVAQPHSEVLAAEADSGGEASGEFYAPSTQSQLEHHWDEWDESPFLLVTQNVDDLHQQAGNQRVLWMHGQLRILRCTRCQRISERMDADSLNPETFLYCEVCAETGEEGADTGEEGADAGEEGADTEVQQSEQAILRPHIVWFHEMPFGMWQIEQHLSHQP